MNMINKYKKGQSLPLNAIVIAILVVVVLLVLILFFTGSFSESSRSVESVQGCNVDTNPVLKSAGWASVFEHSTNADNPVCPGTADRVTTVFPSDENSNGQVTICCGTKE